MKSIFFILFLSIFTSFSTSSKAGLHDLYERDRDLYVFYYFLALAPQLPLSLYERVMEYFHGHNGDSSSSEVGEVLANIESSTPDMIEDFHRNYYDLEVRHQRFQTTLSHFNSLNHEEVQNESELHRGVREALQRFRSRVQSTEEAFGRWGSDRHKIANLYLKNRISNILNQYKIMFRKGLHTSAFYSAVVEFFAFGDCGEQTSALIFEIMKLNPPYINQYIMEAGTYNHSFLVFRDEQGEWFAVDPYYNLFMRLEDYWTHDLVLSDFRNITQNPNWIPSRNVIAITPGMELRPGTYSVPKFDNYSQDFESKWIHERESMSNFLKQKLKMTQSDILERLVKLSFGKKWLINLSQGRAVLMLNSKEEGEMFLEHIFTLNPFLNISLKTPKNKQAFLNLSLDENTLKWLF